MTLYIYRKLILDGERWRRKLKKLGALSVTLIPHSASFKCDLCEKYFAQKAALEKHQRIRLRKTTSCPFCEMSFCTTKELKLHNEKSHKEGTDTKATTGDLDQDIEVKNSRTCPVCHKMFYDYSNVKRHIRSEHEGEASRV